MINGIVEVSVLVIIYPKNRIKSFIQLHPLPKGSVISVEYHLVLYLRLNL